MPPAFVLSQVKSVSNLAAAVVASTATGQFAFEQQSSYKWPVDMSPVPDGRVPRS